MTPSRSNCFEARPDSVVLLLTTVVAVQTIGVIKEPDRLVNYVLLVTATLDRLIKIGGASSEPVAEGRSYALPRRVYTTQSDSGRP